MHFNYNFDFLFISSENIQLRDEQYQQIYHIMSKIIFIQNTKVHWVDWNQQLKMNIKLICDMLVIVKEITVRKFDHNKYLLTNSFYI